MWPTMHLHSWREMQRFAHGPAYATVTPSSIISCFIKSQISLTFLMPAYPGCPGKRPLNGWLSQSNMQNYIHVTSNVMFTPASISTNNSLTKDKMQTHLDWVIAACYTTILNLDMGRWMCIFALFGRTRTIGPREFSADFKCQPTRIFSSSTRSSSRPYHHSTSKGRCHGIHSSVHQPQHGTWLHTYYQCWFVTVVNCIYIGYSTTC